MLKRNFELVGGECVRRSFPVQNFRKIILVKCKPFKISRKLSFYYNNWPCALLIYAFFLICILLFLFCSLETFN